MARIVVAEDDHKQADLVRAYLERDGHAVVVVQDGRLALESVRARRPDLVLLDVMMPRIDGLDVCRALRAEGDTPIIMVTARAAEDDQLLAFDLGADDYVVKPYSMRQLVARVRAVLRRSGGGRDDRAPLTVGALHIDRERCAVTLHGRPVELTPRERALLEALAAQPGRVFSRRELLAEIAGFDHYALERTVDMHVLNLRRKIEEDPARPELLVTVKGRGYRLEDGDAA